MAQGKPQHLAVNADQAVHHRHHRQRGPKVAGAWPETPRPQPRLDVIHWVQQEALAHTHAGVLPRLLRQVAPPSGAGEDLQHEIRRLALLPHREGPQFGGRFRHAKRHHDVRRQPLGVRPIRRWAVEVHVEVVRHQRVVARVVPAQAGKEVQAELGVAHANRHAFPLLDLVGLARQIVLGKLVMRWRPAVVVRQTAPRKGIEQPARRRVRARRVRPGGLGRACGRRAIAPAIGDDIGHPGPPWMRGAWLRLGSCSAPVAACRPTTGAPMGCPH